MMKVKLLPRSVLKGRIGVHFPGAVTGISPIVVDNVGGNFSIAIDMDELDDIIGGPTVGVIAVFDGSGAVIPVSTQLDIPVPFDCHIEECAMYAAQAGSIVIDIWKDIHGSFPPTLADSITAAAKPTIAAADKSLDTTLTGWTRSITAGDILRFNVDSASTIKRVTLELAVTKL
jgi:hypothetical protein